MRLLRNAVRSYAWGSRTALAEFCGQPVPAPHPEAELWMGAHPGDPSRVVDVDGTEISLLDLLESDAVSQLGETCVDRWGSRLPFLLKVLAAEEPLSLQAHPSSEHAREGYAREQAGAVPVEATSRNYPDPIGKPELVCALTEFHALAGFREPHRTVRLLKALDVPSLRSHAELLAGQPDSDGLRALFTTWITLPDHHLPKVTAELLESCVRHVRQHGEFALECKTILELAEAYPHDPGVLACLLLNRHVLQPGEAIFLPPGSLHAYLSGTGLEIQANSDNILRGGLTPKHVDLPELLRVVDFRCAEAAVLTGSADQQRVTTYRTPTDEFVLSRVDWTSHPRDPVRLHSDGPQILLCTKGRVQVMSSDADSSAVSMELRRGEAVWLAAAEASVHVCPIAGGDSQVFRASVGLLE